MSTSPSVHQSPAEYPFRTRSLLLLLCLLAVAATFSGCAVGQRQYKTDPGPPVTRVMVKDYAWYEYNEQWFNNGGPWPWWAYIVMPIAYLVY